MSTYERMLQLSSQGYECVQIMMQLVLDAEEQENIDLIRSLGAFNNGMRDTGHTCGALIGGACIIAYYASNGEPYESADPHFDSMVQELTTWFKEEMGARFGGITCPEMLGNGSRNKLDVCPLAVEETFNKALALLEENDLLD